MRIQLSSHALNHYLILLSKLDLDYEVRYMNMVVWYQWPYPIDKLVI